MDTIGRATADTVDSYLRTNAVQQWIRREMRTNGLSDESAGLVATISRIVLAQVAEAHGRALAPEMDATGLRDLDHAECGALYGFVAGYSRAMSELAATIPVHRVSGD